MRFRSRSAVRSAAILSLALIILALSACGGGGGSEATPTPSIDVASPIGESTVTPIPPPPETAYRLVYQEFGATEDVIWRIAPSDPAQREKLATIPHREGWSVEPSLSPDSRLLAYISVPEEATDPAFQSELFILDLKLQETEQVPVGVDQHFRPLWSPDGRLLYVRKNVPQQVMIEQVVVIRKPAPDDPTPSPSPRPTPTPQDATPAPSPEPTPTPEPIKTVLQAHVSTVLTFIPVGFADDGKSMYFVQVYGGTGGGTGVGRYAPATTEAIAAATAEAIATATAIGPTPEPTPAPTEPTPEPTPLVGSFVVQLSDQIARDYDLSPDKKKLSYLAQEFVEGRFVTRAYVADLVARSSSALSTEGLPPTDNHFRPLWHPDGQRLAIGFLPSAGEPEAIALVPVAGGPPSFLPAPTSGFDVPVAWAPDGSFLAVTNFSGDSLANLGQSRLDLVAPSGQRLTVADGVDVKVVGWFQQPAATSPSPSP